MCVLNISFRDGVSERSQTPRGRTGLSKSINWLGSGIYAPAPRVVLRHSLQQFYGRLCCGLCKMCRMSLIYLLVHSLIYLVFHKIDVHTYYFKTKCV